MNDIFLTLELSTGGVGQDKPVRGHISIPGVQHNTGCILTLTLLRGWWGRCEKNYLRKEEGREGGEKSARSAPAGPGAQTRDLPRARRGSPAARQGGCLDKQAFPCL